MPSCAGCGAHVSEAFVRVFGDNDGKLHGCPNCMTHGELTARGGAEANEGTA